MMLTTASQDAELVAAMSRLYTRCSVWDARSGKNGLTLAQVEALEAKRSVWLYEEYSSWWCDRLWGSISTMKG